MRSRLEALERIFTALQEDSAEDADQLLSRIRFASGGMDLSPLSASTDSSPGIADAFSASVSEPSTAPPTSTAQASCSTPDTGASSDSEAVLSMADRSPSVPDHAFELTPAHLVRVVFPGAATTKAALDCFYRCSGSLFHVFTAEQSYKHFDDVFGLLDRGLSPSNLKVSACYLAAVAAVGVQYSPEDFEPGTDEILYEVARQYFSHVAEDQPLDGIRVCAMLAMFNVMAKRLNGIAYIELGLNISRRHSLQDRSYQFLGISLQAWTDYRRAWRTLMFFSGWLSSTLGYISGNGNDCSLRQIASHFDEEFDDASQFTNTIHQEMTKVSLLKANVLRMHLSSPELSIQAIRGAEQELHDWYRQLPAEMQLIDLMEGNRLSGTARWSIFHIHLLHLGAIMLLFQRIASQYARPQQESRGHEDDTTWTPPQEMLCRYVCQALTAARQSARILSLLMAEMAVFKRCWLIIFQSHTSCLMLLQSAAESQLYPSSGAKSASEDLALARTCLDTLSFCGSTDPVAFEFYSALTPIYDKLLSYNNGTSAGSVAALSTQLQAMLCRPFGCSEDNGKNEAPNSAQWPISSTGRTSFRWQIPALGPGGLDANGPMHRFLDSIRPSGWSEVGEEDFCNEVKML